MSKTIQLTSGKKCGKCQNSKPLRAQLSIPLEISENPQLLEAMRPLPSHYDFEIAKTIWQLRKNNIRKVALQFPEGLLMFSCIIADILERFADVETVIMGDVTYGACCVDDFTAKALNCDFMVHYGHSCLVPIDISNVKVLYIFVTIRIPIDSLAFRIRDYFPEHSRIACVSTIQFASALPALREYFNSQESCKIEIFIPQVRPLSPGEVLGCTSPVIADALDENVTTSILYVGDGRFHLEAVMIANPNLPAFRYDPYSDILSKEEYDFSCMHTTRKYAIDAAKKSKTIGLILSTLGRQGNPAILKELHSKFKATGIDVVNILLGEITPLRLEPFSKKIDAWVQVACPRLSIDWGWAFPQPILSPYEASVLLDRIQFQSDRYPMDYYAKSSLGPWTNYHPDIVNLSNKA